MLKRYGGEEGLREFYREMKRKSMEHPNNKKGTAKRYFSNPEVAKEAGAKGLEKRWKSETSR